MGSTTQAGAEALKLSAAAAWRRLLKYIAQLPLLTRAIIVIAIPAVHAATMFGAPVSEKWALDPRGMDLTQSWFFLLRVLGRGGGGVGGGQRRKLTVRFSA